MLKNKQNLILLLTLLVCIESAPDLMLGTGGFGYGCGSNTPAAQLPYSFVRLGPDTTPMIKQKYAPFQHYGGYHDSDHAVLAFSHMHLVGAGVLDMGVIGILPIVAHNASNSPSLTPNKSTPFDKSLEYASPGYYSTFLTTQNVKVELTTSQRCGAHRYTYTNRQNKPLDIYFLTSHLLQKGKPRITVTEVCGKNCVQGKIKYFGSFGGRMGGATANFYAEIKAEGEGTMYLYENQTFVSGTTASGNYSGAVFRTKSNTVQILIGISYVSIQNAKDNYENEVKGKTFQQIRKLSKQVWDKQLGRFDIYAVNEQVQTKIDTAIYRTLQSPTIFQDFNGEYLSFANNGSISKKPTGMQHIYTDMSLWDVHRSQMPWILFHDPERFNDIAMSLVLFNRNGGYMPKWPFAQGATGCMIGAHANTVLADWIIKQAYKNPNKFNITQIFEYMLRNANNQTPHDARTLTDKYPTIGYIPYENDKHSSCSQTLEYSYNDFGISQIAKLLNRTEEQKQFVRRSKFYKNVFNNKSKFFQPRHQNGTFKSINILQRIDIFSPYYVQGDAWHYRFYAPHDAKGLIQLFGQKYFVKELDHFFGRSFAWPTFWFPDPYYWAGNEHNLFSVWLFPYANRSDLTQRYSRQIIDSFYGLKGDGLPGNDDYGTMSAWLIFSCLGLYPLPSTPTYILGSPYVHYASINRKIQTNKYQQFRVRAYQNTKKNVHVKRVEFNGREEGAFVQHGQFGREGGDDLMFWMKR